MAMDLPEKPGRRRILVVDDDHLVADTLALVFSRTGFDACVCYGAETAIPCARRFRPDLLVCDVMLPGSDGFSLVRQISREHPSCQVVIFTGSQPTAEMLEQQTCKLPRPPAILTKPCQPSDLLREVNAILACA